MPRRGDNIRKRKDGRWEGRFISHYDPDGKAVYRSVYAKSYSDVREKVKAEERQFLELHYDSCSSSKTFGDIAKEWLAIKSTTQKRSTIAKYTTILHKHILPEFDHIQISSFNTRTINDFMSNRYADASSSLYSSIVSVMKSVLEYAVQEGHLSSISYRKTKRPSEKQQTTILSDAERIRLETYLLADPDLSKLGVYLCLYTGMRIGEVCALKWSDIDLFSNIIRIRNTVQRLPSQNDNSEFKTELVIMPPKSISSIRDIPIPLHLSDLLKAVQASADQYFLTGRTNKPMEPRCLQQKFKKYLDEAGVCNINFHSLRHTFASRCIAVGVDIKTVSEVLGHNSVEITLNRYVHTSEEQKRSQLSLLFADSGQNAAAV